MHVKTLRVFVDVAALRSFSRAAEQHGLSQSAVSQMVHQLERHLGAQLIDRSRRPPTLTPAGQVFYEGCRRLVRGYDALEDRVRRVCGELAGRVRVASIYSAGLSHMARLMKEFLRRYPKANVRLEYQHPAAVYALVEEGRADFGLVSYPRGSRILKATLWREEPMVLVCAPDHPWASRRSVRLEELDGREMVAFDEQLTIRRAIDRALARHRAEARVVMAFDNIETLKSAVEIGAGVAILPAPTVERETQLGVLAAIPLEGESLVRPLGIVQRRDAELSETARQFLSLLREDRAAAPEREGAAGRADQPAAAPVEWQGV